MATRLTGFKSRLGTTRPIAAVGSWSRLRRSIFGGILLLGVLAACSSTTTYPIDYFSAMHYQHSYRTLEPPRFMAPEGAVPVQGRAPQYSSAQILELENPIPADEASIAMGQQLFNVNCAVCHGEGGNGDGLMAPFLESQDARPPADLTDNRLVNVEDNYFYNTMTNGLPPFMPAFGDLIEGQQMWHIVNYIRTLQGAQ